MTAVMDGHIQVDDHGIARIADSRIKVTHLVMEKVANGWTQQNFPHLSAAQVYAALAFYHDHKQQLDEQIEQSLEIADRASEGRVPLLLERLRSEGKLP